LLRSELQEKRIFIFDADGVLWKGENAIEEAKTALNRIRELGGRVTLLTNNSTKSRNDFVVKIRKVLQFSLEKDDIVNSAYATALYLQQHFDPGSCVLPVGEQGINIELEEAGFRIIHSVKQGTPVAVVVGMDRHITYDKIRQALRAILAGAIFIATNPDPTFPVPDGLDPGAGASVGAVAGACGRPPDLIIGKPNPLILTLALEKWDEKPEHAVMIGDRLSTDILCANKAKITAIHVLTGVSEANDGSISPDFTLNTLSELFLE